MPKADLAREAILRNRTVSEDVLFQDAEERIYGELHRTKRQLMAQAYVDPGGATMELATAVEEMLLGEKRLHEDEKAYLGQRILTDTLGMGVLQPLRDMPQVTDIMVNDWDSVHVVMSGRRYRTDICFASPNAWEGFAKRLVATSNRAWTEECPMVLIKLEDGTRVRLMRPPLTSVVVATMRKARKCVEPVTAKTMVRGGTLNQRALDFLAWAVGAKLCVLCAGETNTGKTTTLRVLLSLLRPEVGHPVVVGGVRFVPASPRLCILEHTRELEIEWSNLVSIEAVERATRQGSIYLDQAMKGVLQKNPEWIIFGEILGPEAYPMLDAALSGHPILATIHAGNARAALDRLTTAALLSGVPLSPERLLEMACEGVNLIIEHHWYKNERRITGIVEVVKGGLRDIFRLGPQGLGQVSGVSLELADKISNRSGEKVPAEWLLSY